MGRSASEVAAVDASQVARGMSVLHHSALQPIMRGHERPQFDWELGAVLLGFSM